MSKILCNKNKLFLKKDRMKLGCVFSGLPGKFLPSTEEKTKQGRFEKYFTDALDKYVPKENQPFSGNQKSQIAGTLRSAIMKRF